MNVYDDDGGGDGGRPSSRRMSRNDYTDYVQVAMELELRLADLERVADVSSRLDGLMRSALSTSSKRGALHDDFLAINKLLLELDISSIAGPTANADEDDAPLVYRRYEILANAESMRRDMEILARIRDLVAIGTKAGGAGEAANCPIVTTSRYDISNDPDAIDRLDRLCYRVANLSGRAVDASRRADNMLNSYGKIVMALSEKMVLAEEQLKEAAAR